MGPLAKKETKTHEQDRVSLHVSNSFLVELRQTTKEERALSSSAKPFLPPVTKIQPPLPHTGLASFIFIRILQLIRAQSYNHA